ncbi:Lrp/AsnC family transcriptional regulator [Candidatus Woesearchaeota archaeon]|nr:Lrp/AsnC family transcriptional regulator [Candidatus Woesearchaeota archaeon]
MISEKDSQIIRELRKNSRASLKEIAERLGLPSSTVHDKVRRFEGNIIEKHTTLLNFKELGYFSHFFLSLKTKREKRNELKEFLKSSRYSNTVYQVNDKFDFLVEVVFYNLKEAQDFFDQLKECFPIEDLYVHSIIDNVKKEEFLS